ncbi:glycoside hydrolase family 2 protein [Lachnoclostridium sp. Marseille-P6806]|uniref:glycoside hydrolase family 2 protein n=1 Tax=Lachnoclostridium sp. Marseille-P6806 TaxID=2364793 RepID=UPI001031A944|nr:sugar-binding domain-containing protein [Lachnoclostridium sp. Marseille-P6806]
MRIKEALSGKWQFCLDPERKGEREHFFARELPDAEDVQIPHTYNVGSGTDDYRGCAWYQYCFDAPEEWRGKAVRVQFGGIYRDAHFWLNGRALGKHEGSGFTSFAVDLTEAVCSGERNRLTVQVDNRYSPYALPWYDQFDWADDGGIFRPCCFLVTETTAVEELLVDAQPVLSGTGEREIQGAGQISLRIRMLAGSRPSAFRYELSDEGERLAAGTWKPGETIHVPRVKYWHFDSPELYDFCLTVIADGEKTDTLRTRIGFRSFCTDGKEFVLNGERIEVAGTEWMPGSDPRIGNAERPEDIGRFLQLLKDTNCIYTRVHWQQDDSFYEWADEHGLMVQEEVPLWGMPKEPTADTLERVRDQCAEMISSHYNHPSLVSWGVGNELNGQSEATKRYVTAAVRLFHEADPYRPVSYVSNTAWESPDDAASRGDIMMCNEYIGTWHQGFDNEEAVGRFREANPDKPMLISEFGLCEPAFLGGDERRREIFLSKLGIYRRTGVNGFIYFCLNDYRTQMGEDGNGRFRERIHGSADMFGNPKPSYEAVREECSPLLLTGMERRGDEITVRLTVRSALPRYEVRGYSLRLSANGEASSIVKLPDGRPGETMQVTMRVPAGRMLQLALLRPTGDIVFSRKLRKELGKNHHE